MKNLAEISNITEAKAHIAATVKELGAHREPRYFQPLSSLIESLSNLYREGRRVEEYEAYKVALAGAIEPFTAQYGGGALPFAPCLFLLLKFGFGITDDTESSGIVRYRLTNSLLNIFSIPSEKMTFRQITSHEHYNSFLNAALELSNHLIEKPAGPVPSLDDKIKELIPALPEDYDGRAKTLAALNAATRRVIAEQLTLALNKRVQAMPHETYEEKKELARWVNDQLEPLGLAVQDPKTGLPAKLRGFTGNWPGVGRFTFEVYRDGKRERTSFSDKLPELTLTDASPAKEPEIGWQQAVGPKDSRTPRRR